MAHRTRMSALAVLALASVAAAQSNDPAPAPSASAPVLSGPRVESTARAATLVERDETGRIKRLEIPPAEAALRLLQLDDEAKARTQKILDARAATLDRIVKENLLLLVNLSNAAQSGDKEQQRRLVRELIDKGAAMRERGPLQAELVRALPEKHGAELKRLVDEYMRAIFDEAAGGDPDSMDGDEKKSRGALAKLAQAEYAAALGREIKRSYERVVTASVEDFDELLKSLDLTPEKEAEIRRIVGDHFQKTAGNPTPAQRAEVFAKIYQELSPEQRRALLSTVRARGE